MNLISGLPIVLCKVEWAFPPIASLLVATFTIPVALTNQLRPRGRRLPYYSEIAEIGSIQMDIGLLKISPMNLLGIQYLRHTTYFNTIELYQTTPKSTEAWTPCIDIGVFVIAYTLMESVTYTHTAADVINHNGRKTVDSNRDDFARYICIFRHWFLYAYNF